VGSVWGVGFFWGGAVTRPPGTGIGTCSLLLEENNLEMTLMAEFKQGVKVGKAEGEARGEAKNSQYVIDLINKGLTLE